MLDSSHHGIQLVSLLQLEALGAAALLTLALRPALALLLNFPYIPAQFRVRFQLGRLMSRLNQTGSSPAALTVLRLSDAPGGQLKALQIQSPLTRPLTIRAGCGILLQSIQGQLRAQGARIEEARALLAPSFKRQAARLAADFITNVSCVILPWPLVWAAIFWSQWALTGTVWLYAFFLSIPMCVAASGLALASPLKSWLAVLFYAAWRNKTPTDARPVQIIDELRFARLMRRVSRQGWLRADPEGLTLGAAGQTWRIPHQAIVNIALLERTSFLSFLVSPIGRFAARPVRLTWRAEEQGVPVLHSVLLAPRAARGFLGNLRSDRRFAATLLAWRERPDASPIQSLSPRPSALARLAPALRPATATLFVLVCLAAPFLHNHLIMTRIRTGQWRPHPKLMAEYRPAYPFIGFLPSRDAIDPSAFVCTGDPLPLLDFGGPDRRPYNRSFEHIFRYDARRASLETVALGGFVKFLSFPGAPTHVLMLHAHSDLQTVTLPVNFDYMNEDSKLDRFPHQVIELATGRQTEIRSLTDALRSNRRSQFALFGDRLFYAFATYNSDYSSEKHSLDAEYGWVDASRDRRHALGRLKIGDFDYAAINPEPVFFPDGRHVLYAWQVIDCQTGETRPVIPAVKQKDPD